MAKEDPNFSVMDMVDDYASEHDVDPKEVFKQTPAPENVEPKVEQGEQEEVTTPVEEGVDPAEPVVKQKKDWVPDPSLTQDMPELHSQGAVYDKSEVVLEETTELKNIADDNALQEASESMDDLTRKQMNIEEAKARHKIAKLHIPPGEMQVKMLIAAGDTNHQRAQAQLDTVIAEIDKTYPEFIEYAPEADKPESTGAEDTSTPVKQGEEVPEENSEEVTPPAEFGTSEAPVQDDPTTPITPKFKTGEESMEGGAKIVIDKRNVTEVSWSQEEVDKIKKSRTIELNIVEGLDLEFGAIKDVDTSKVDLVLSQYQRKTNDVVAALPASKYRATFTGLTYPEVIDLSSSNEMNTLDGERKKWSICFNHIKNPSIGPWEEYVLYKDPETGKMIKIDMGTEVPENVPETDVHYVSKFEDFLRKTSYMDLEFMLWKILCATAMDKEVISIDCHATVDGKTCGNSYDWIYNPADLLSMDSISPTVLEEMKQTGEVSTTQEILENYNTSPVCSNQYVTLHTSGFMPVYGHISGYEYLNEIYAKIKQLEDPENNDPTIVSRAMAYTALTSIKAFLIPSENGFQRITGADNLVKVLDMLDEIDWQTISEITRLMIEPYQFRFSMRDIVCPKCKNRSVITIDSMSRLLFIVARSLSSVQVTLRKA